jgi:hypothetical protein
MANDVTSKVLLGLDANEFRRGIQQVDAKLKETSKLFDNLGAAVGAAFIGSQIQAFIVDAVRLGDQLTKVSQGFARFGGEANLEQLRQSTRGLVSDLELMKTATKAGTFGIGIGEMGQLLNFATRRAQETGQEVDYLVDSIVTGIGRKSPLILDNLGISATALREKLNGVSVEAASIGEVSRAVGQIASEQLRLMGESADTAADKLQRVNTIWANFKAETGQWVSRTGLAIAEIFGQLLTGQSLIGALTPSTSVGASEPNRPAGPAALNFGNFSEQTLANMRAQLAAFNAELENVAIGSARFKELKASIDAVTKKIQELTAPAKEVFKVPTEEAIKLNDKGLKPVANGIVYMNQVLKTAGIPAFDEFGRMIKGAKEQLELMDEQLQLASAVGAEFGYILSSAFTAAMNNGTSFFDELQNAIKNYVRQLATAVATTLALSAIVSAFTGMPLGVAFRGVAQGTGLGGIFGEGGILNMQARISGRDTLLTNQRNGSDFSRISGG